MSKNSILENQTGSRGRLTDYNKSLTTFELFHYKIILYMVSFILRIFTKILVKKMTKNGKVNKKLFYFVYYHNKIHFILFNLYLSGCIFLNTRSILHMKYLPQTLYQFFDKYINLLCFFFYWWDILELLHTSQITGKTAADFSTSSPINGQQYNQVKASKELKEVKRCLKKMKKERKEQKEKEN